jgi:ATP/maltotriose-dependent transcriptional regulator MalT
LNKKRQAELGITPRELEIFGLIANGLSNREIAEISLSAKTPSRPIPAACATS